MVKVAYFHDGTSTYDRLFLDQLVRDNTTYFLTFYSKPRMIPEMVKVIRIREPFDAFTETVELTEGLRMYVLFLLRALLFKLALRKIKPDLVMGCMATKQGFYAALSGFKPFILIVWGSDIQIAPKRSLLLRFMAQYSLRKADAVVVDSDVQRKVAIGLGCDRAKIIQFPWFDLEKVHVLKDRSKLRGQLEWSDNIIVVCTRSHEPVYGVDYLIEAMPHIVKEVPQIRLLLLGDGHLTSHLKTRVKVLNIGKYVRFLGCVPQKSVATYLNSSDIYVSPSLSDGTSSSLLEAMICHLPPIVTDISGNKEWIHDGLNGLLVPVANPQLLAEAIITVAKKKDLRQRISDNAYMTVQEKVNWRKASNAMQDLISKLAKRN